MVEEKQEGGVFCPSPGKIGLISINTHNNNNSNNNEKKKNNKKNNNTKKTKVKITDMTTTSINK